MPVIARAPTSSDRLFWLVAALVVLSFGAVASLAYVMCTSRQRESTQLTWIPSEKTAAPAPPPVEASEEMTIDVSQDALKAQLNALASAQQQQPAAEPATKSETPATDSAPTAQDNPPAEAPKPPPEKAEKTEKPDVNPYMVPTNKPYISQDMFGVKPAAGAATRPKTPAELLTKPPEKEKPKTAAKTPAPPATPGNSIAASTAPLEHMNAPLSGGATGGFRGKIYVMKDGRRIATVSTVDLGDSYGVKDLNSLYVTILKSDVAEVLSR